VEAAPICNCPAIRCLIERDDASPLADEADALKMAITASSRIFIEVLNAAMDKG
jgi:hypothetical protein